MAAITDYSSLQSAVQDLLRNRSDVTAALVQGWITLAEAAMNRKLSTRLTTTRTTITITAETLAVPADFGGAISMLLQSDPVSELAFATPDGLSLRANNTNLTNTGNPDTYSVEGSNFRFFPIPSANIDAKLTYRQRIPALSGSAMTNWVITNHPDAYLYGTAVHSAPWLGRDERLGMWVTAFSEILDEISEADKIEVFASNLRMQPAVVI